MVAQSAFLLATRACALPHCCWRVIVMPTQLPHIVALGTSQSCPCAHAAMLCRWHNRSTGQKGAILLDPVAVAPPSSSYSFWHAASSGQATRGQGRCRAANILFRPCSSLDLVLLHLRGWLDLVSGVWGHPSQLGLPDCICKRYLRFICLYRFLLELNLISIWFGFVSF
jgi:hypothetical protein